MCLPRAVLFLRLERSSCGDGASTPRSLRKNLLPKRAVVIVVHESFNNDSLCQGAGSKTPHLVFHLFFAASCHVRVSSHLNKCGSTKALLHGSHLATLRAEAPVSNHLVDSRPITCLGEAAPFFDISTTEGDLNLFPFLCMSTRHDMFAPLLRTRHPNRSESAAAATVWITELSTRTCLKTHATASGRYDESCMECCSTARGSWA